MDTTMNVQIILTIVTSIAASSGFWAWFTRKGEKKDLKTKILLGLAHDRIIELGLVYLKRDYITPDELENLNEYLYEPYAALGGNGTAETIVNGCKRLRVVPNPPERESINDENE